MLMLCRDCHADVVPTKVYKDCCADIMLKMQCSVVDTVVL